MTRIAFTFFLCVATLMATQKARAAGPKATPPPQKKKRSLLQSFDLQPRSRAEKLPVRTDGLDPGLYGEWFRRRFLWSPEEAVPHVADPGRGALDHLTEIRWVEPKRDGLYRYVRKRARSYYKRLYVRQLDSIWESDPSFTANDYGQAMRRYRRACAMQDGAGRSPTIQEVLERRRPVRAARYPYVARLGPVRVDEDYRVQIDMHDLFGETDDADGAVEGASGRGPAVRGRRRKASRGRWFDLKISPRVAVGASYDQDRWVRNYGGRVSVAVLPRPGRGPLFTSAAKLKITPDGKATLTIDLFHKRF